MCALLASIVLNAPSTALLLEFDECLHSQINRNLLLTKPIASICLLGFGELLTSLKSNSNFPRFICVAPRVINKSFVSLSNFSQSSFSFIQFCGFL